MNNHNNEDFDLLPHNIIPPPPPPQQQGSPCTSSSVSTPATASPNPGSTGGGQETARKKVWTQQEDELLRILVARHGERAWSRIADELKTINNNGDMPGRIGKQCRDRWCNHLSPDLDKNKWTMEEDEKLFEAVRNLGNQWAEIARTVLPGRSDLSIKNRYYSRMRRENRKAEVNNANNNAELHFVHDSAAAGAVETTERRKKSPVPTDKPSKSTMYSKSNKNNTIPPPPTLLPDLAMPGFPAPTNGAPSSSSSPMTSAFKAPPPPSQQQANRQHLHLQQQHALDLNDFMVPSPGSGPSLFSGFAQSHAGTASPPTGFSFSSSQFASSMSVSTSSTNNNGGGNAHLTSHVLNHLFSPFSSPHPSPPHSPSSHNRLLPSRPTSRPVSPSTVMGAINQHFQSQGFSFGGAQASGTSSSRSAQDLSLLSTTMPNSAQHSPLPDFDIYSASLTGGGGGQNSAFRLSPPASSASTPSTNRPSQFFSSSSIATVAAAAAQQGPPFFPSMASRVVGGIELLPHPHHYHRANSSSSSSSSTGHANQPPPPSFVYPPTQHHPHHHHHHPLHHIGLQAPQPAAATAVMPQPKRPRKSSTFAAKPKQQQSPLSGDESGGSAANAGLNVGRWTPEEHELFERGLAQYGTQDWAKITELVSTRTIVQIRSHAQKYFLKLGYTPKNAAAAASGKGDAGEMKKPSAAAAAAAAAQEMEDDDEDAKRLRLQEHEEDTDSAAATEIMM